SSKGCVTAIGNFQFGRSLCGRREQVSSQKWAVGRRNRFGYDSGLPAACLEIRPCSRGFGKPCRVWCLSEAVSRANRRWNRCCQTSHWRKKRKSISNAGSSRSAAALGGPQAVDGDIATAKRTVIASMFVTLWKLLHWCL